MVPNRSSVSSRLDVDLASADGTGTTIPLVVANMTAIAGRRMAETTARRGALTVIPQDIPAEVVRDVVSWQKSRHLVYDTPITLDPTTTVGEAMVLLHKRAHGAALVTAGERPVGIVTETDLTGVDRFTRLEDVMVRDMVTLHDGVDVEVGVRHPLATRGAGWRRSWRTTAGWSASSPAPGRCGPTSTRRRPTVRGGCSSRGRRHQRRRRDQGQGPAGRRRRRARHRHRPRSPGEDDRRPALGAGARPRGCRWWRATSSSARAPATCSRRARTSSRWASARGRCARPA